MSEVVVFSGGPHPLVATPGESFEIARRDSIIEVAAAAAYDRCGFGASSGFGLRADA